MDYLVIMRMGDTKDPEIQRKRAALEAEAGADGSQLLDELGINE